MRSPVRMFLLHNPSRSWPRKVNVRVERKGAYLVVTRPSRQWSLFVKWWK